MMHHDTRAVLIVFDILSEQGRSQRWLARQLGVWEPRLSDWKAGRKAAPDWFVDRACALMGVPPSVIYSLVRVVPEGTAKEEAAA